MDCLFASLGAGMCEENWETKTVRLRVTERASLANLLRPCSNGKQLADRCVIITIVSDWFIGKSGRKIINFAFNQRKNGEIPLLSVLISFFLLGRRCRFVCFRLSCEVCLLPQRVHQVIRNASPVYNFVVRRCSRHKVIHRTAGGKKEVGR